MVLELKCRQEGKRKGIEVRILEFEVRILELRLKAKQVEKPTLVWVSYGTELQTIFRPNLTSHLGIRQLLLNSAETGSRKETNVIVPTSLKNKGSIWEVCMHTSLL